MANNILPRCQTVPNPSSGFTSALSWLKEDSEVPPVGLRVSRVASLSSARLLRPRHAVVVRGGLVGVMVVQRRWRAVGLVSPTRVRTVVMMVRDHRRLGRGTELRHCRGRRRRRWRHHEVLVVMIWWQDSWHVLKALLLAGR